MPIIDYYRDHAACSTVVDGVGDGDEVFERLVKVCVEQLALAGCFVDGPAQDR